MEEYCPDCVVELKRQSKQLGWKTVWMVCPKCGFRKRPLSIFDKLQEEKDFNDYIDSVNNKNKERYDSN